MHLSTRKYVTKYQSDAFKCFDGPKLIEPKNALYTETELEDCLDAADFYLAAERSFENYNAFSKNFKQNKDSKFTEINNGLKFLIPKGAKGYQDLNVIKAMLSNHKIKYDISMNYAIISFSFRE